MYLKIAKSTFYSFLFCFQLTVFAQDSITVGTMEPYTYDFDITDGKFQGEGAKVLQDAVSKANITMVANTVNSKLDVQFSNTLLSVLSSNGYRKIALEEGGVSGNIISEMAKEPGAVRQLKELNSQYSFRKEGLVRTPIPSLKSVEAGKFIQNIGAKDWAIFGIGIEDWTSYGMIIEDLYANISKEDQSRHKELYRKTKEVLDTGYRDFGELNNDGALKFMNTLGNSESFISFLAEMGKYESNKEMVYHFKKSLDYWSAYGNRNYFEKNLLSIEEAKNRLATLLKTDGFDFSKDKLFVKMFIGHLGKGITSNGFYGVGSMLHEMTEYYGNTNLSIGLIPRYFERDGVVEDYLESDLYYLKIFKEFMPLGKKDEWVLVDLRPFNEKLFYGPYMTSPFFSKVISRYDMLIIPKTDSEPTMNY